MLQLNLHTPLRLTRGLAGSMAGKPNHAYIINISSIAGRQPMPNNAIYAATKWGFTGFTVSIFEARPRRPALRPAPVHARCCCGAYACCCAAHAHLLSIVACLMSH